MGEQVVLLCRVIADRTPELFDAVIDTAMSANQPNALWRAEKSGGWTEYKRVDLWMPRKDGVFSPISVFVNGEIEPADLIDHIWATFDAAED